VDILDVRLDRARSRATHLGDRVHFEDRSVYDLGLPAASFDLTLCRHVLHAIPHAEQAIMELLRVTRPGGVLHLIAEDYGMIHFPVRRFDPRAFWPDSALRFGASTGTDLLIGCRVPGILAALGLQQVAIRCACLVRCAPPSGRRGGTGIVKRSQRSSGSAATKQSRAGMTR
jgi:SAM-dependent methyltransferase